MLTTHYSSMRRQCVANVFIFDIALESAISDINNVAILSKRSSMTLLAFQVTIIWDYAKLLLQPSPTDSHNQYYG